MTTIRQLFLTLLFALQAMILVAQPTFPKNGARGEAESHYIFINAQIHVSGSELIEKGYLEIINDKIVGVGSGKKSNKGAIIIDLNGKHIYASFIDLHSNYGMPPAAQVKRNGKPQMTSNKKGAYAWNEAIKPEIQASEHFHVDPKTAGSYRSAGFGAVLSHNFDGIARGSGVLVSLGESNDNACVLSANTSCHLSLNKGLSKQSYPSSLMGSIALLRQTYLDAKWYGEIGFKKETNLSLQAFNELKPLPTFFDAGSYINQQRAQKIALEFKQNYIYVGRGDEYKRLHELKKLPYSVVIPLHFPKAIDATDPYETMLVSLSELKSWELAPTNPSQLEKNEVLFSVTSHGLKNKGDLIKNLRIAVKHGLSKAQAINSLTVNPAEMIGLSDQIGSVKKNNVANFLIVSKDLFQKDAIILENWTQGVKYQVNPEPPVDARGEYDLKIGASIYKLSVSGKQEKLKASIKVDTSKVPVSIKFDRELVAISFDLKDSTNAGAHRLSGKSHYDSGIWEGNGRSPNGNWISWNAVRIKKHEDKATPNRSDSLNLGKIWFPNRAYGLDSLPVSQTILIKNATVWTNEAEGIIEKTNVLVKNGKIQEINPNLLDARDALIIDAEGKHLTSGIIDEHSHIAISGGANESGQAIAAEVRIGDVINPDDVNIYRQLAGGVTSSQLLHGSANPIGGQSALVKLKWGYGADDMKIKNAPGFIKFALGENVKQSNWGDQNTIRFPQTRMGVEQVFYDGFISAREYETKIKNYVELSSKRNYKGDLTAPRRDLELEALLEILNHTRFITCHSYVQSEINMLMHVADSMGFTLNTFTHILEGYKVADKMKAHGAGASTFSDWWGYKYEVKDAIPYNASLLNEMGIVTAINSDDAEMARRLNQEAAKAVKYGGTSEEDAWKMITLNPAKLLHLDDRMGSIKVGKDADLVLWSDNPLSVYAHVEKTIIEGAIFYDYEQDLNIRKRNEQERERILSKMLKAKENGVPVRSAKMTSKQLYDCTKEAQK